ncbi:SET domain-containing protein [Westerdykella ornata]|uniref:SET domain-containing protein n=1 Tax=Westerdykella ornata TaxID=318751 RepID=A0A6A6JXH9_WESOR|nr:SET domain-containing protein [Westerdykella ornata]KAF2280773.1 SET domain-containing protein [Westerdykella ornata]
MRSAKPTRHSYEESPERLKELFKTPAETKPTPSPAKISRDQLLKEHQVQLKLLSEGNVPVRTFVLPLPYPPSRISLRNVSSSRIKLEDLNVERRIPNTYIILRTITIPYVYSASITVAEDEDGNVCRVTLCNLEDSVVEPLIPEGTVLAIKEPFWTRLVDGGYHVRVDQPSDVEELKPHDELVPKEWRKEEIDVQKDATQWKKEGDMMFLKKRFRNALECYDRGLKELDHSTHATAAIDLYRKKCGVNIVLLRLDDAVQDLALAISTHAASTPSLADSPLTNPPVINEWLRNHSMEDPHQIATQIPNPLKVLAARIKFDLGIFQSEPVYDLPLISSYVGPLTLHVDAANYICDTEARSTESHGRGLFAKRSFKAGDLVCAEKAFTMPGYFIQDRNSDCFLYSLGDETASPRPGALLFKELVQKLRSNPTLRKEYFDLDDGGYWKKNGWEVEEGEEIPIDVFRVEKIRQLNCFSVPTRSLDLLTQPPNSNPELRAGFWLHASYLNHSCLPNTVRTFIGDVHFLRATRDIDAGEELTQQYISPEIDIEDRQRAFEGTWGFRCDCKLCEVDGSISAEKRRQRLERFAELKAVVMKLGERGTTITSIKKIARGLRELETLYSAPQEENLYANLPRLGLVHPTLFLTEAWRGVGNTGKMIEYARRLLRNFGILTSVAEKKFEVTSNSGFVNVEGVRALKYLGEGYRAMGELEMSEQCTNMAKVWFRIVTGSDVGADEFLRS